MLLELLVKVTLEVVVVESLLPLDLGLVILVVLLLRLLLLVALIIQEALSEA